MSKSRIKVISQRHIREIPNYISFKFSGSGFKLAPDRILPRIQTRPVFNSSQVIGKSNIFIRIIYYLKKIVRALLGSNPDPEPTKA